MNLALRNDASRTASDRFGGRPAEMRLGFVRAPDGSTHVAEQYAPYPFHVCRPFRYAGDPAGMATVYLQSASGGIYEHERLGMVFSAADGAAAHVTSQASTIVHGMPSGSAKQDVVLRLGRDAWFEYLPDPLILFPDARIETRLRLVLADGAQAIVGDGCLAHDPAAEGRPFGRLASEVRIERGDGTLIACDAFDIDGDAFRRALSVGERDHATHGTMAMVSTPAAVERALVAVPALLDGDADIYGGASLLPGGIGIWARLVARDGVALKRTSIAIWRAMRFAMTGTMPAPRRK